MNIGGAQQWSRSSGDTDIHTDLYIRLRVGDELINLSNRPITNTAQLDAMSEGKQEAH